MKSSISTTVFVAFIVIPWCSLLAADDTAELQKLKTSYTAASERALAPIKVTYMRELERLKEAYTKAGKLEAAIAVKVELESLSATATNGTNSPASVEKDDNPSKRETEKLLTAGTWSFFQLGASEDQKGRFEHKVEFKKGGKAAREGKNDTKWEITKDGELLYQTDIGPWACRFKRKSDTLWAGVGIGSNAAGMKFVHLEKNAP